VFPHSVSEEKSRIKDKLAHGNSQQILLVCLSGAKFYRISNMTPISALIIHKLPKLEWLALLNGTPICDIGFCGK
jgi:hypothetical protein